jgi:hypothetical protein
MITLVSENPLKYEDESGDELPIQIHICSEHGGEIKYIVEGENKVIVYVPAEEATCQVWPEELELL